MLLSLLRPRDRLSRDSQDLPPSEPEIFLTVQGEGESVGVPCVFVRLAECNLRCTWCDTKYTWDWATHDRARETLEVDADDIARRVLAVAPELGRRAVFTGGEPLLQMAELVPILARLRSEGFAIEVETNGT